MDVFSNLSYCTMLKLLTDRWVRWRCKEGRHGGVKDKSSDDKNVLLCFLMIYNKQWVSSKELVQQLIKR